MKTIKNGSNAEITYTYGNTNWKDQLTKYNGKTITYDNIGNALTYDGNTYTWQNGRQLAGITNSSKNQTITYKYNESGIRTQKTVNGTTTNYYLDGAKVIYEQTGNNVIYYTYDENGNIIGLKYNDTQYYYIRNGQNDIIGILDSNLNQVVRYEYDSWGNILSIKDSNGNNITSSTNIGIINPYRYRSYRYDTETGLYYLQSRYYNPEWGRFINFDNYGGQVGELLSHNGYIYCCNNPVNMIDEDGNFAILITAILAVVVTVVSIATVPQDTWTNIGNSITETATTIGDRISSAVSNINTKRKNKTQTQTVTKTTTKTKDSEEPQYWSADMKANKIAPLTYSDAQLRVKTGGNIIASNQVLAFKIASTYHVRKLEIDKDKEGVPGYYWHYHINGKHGAPHIWFEGPKLFDY